MQFLNLPTEFFTGRAWRANEPVDRASFMSLLAHCALEENGGRITGAKSWGERKWMSLVGITKAESMGEPMGELPEEERLWRWEGDDLIVDYYPIEKEREIQAKREGGRKGAIARWKNAGRHSSPIEKPYGERNVTEPKRNETGVARDVIEIMAWIGSLHPNWSTPAAWDRSEVELVTDNREALIECMAIDIGSLLRSYVRDGIGKEQRFWPKTRSQFAKSPSDVISKAREWASRRRWSPPQPSKEAPLAITPKEIDAAVSANTALIEEMKRDGEWT